MTTKQQPAVNDRHYNPYRVGEEQTRCPVCEDSYKALGIHFDRSSCTAPALSDRQQQVLQGALLVGGRVFSTPGGKYGIRLCAPQEATIQWIGNELGWLTNRIHHVEDSFGTGAADTITTNKLRTYSIAQLRRYREDWYTDAGERTGPTTLPRSPRLLRTAYVLGGSVQSHGDGIDQITIGVGDTQPPPELLWELFAGFGPKLEGEREQGTYKIHLSNPQRFFRFIGWNPPPIGAADRWPSPEDIAEKSSQCPVCRAAVDGLANHWTRAEHHDVPSLSPPRFQLLVGLVAANAYLVTHQHHSSILASSRSEARLQWLHDQLGWVGTSVREKPTGTESTSTHGSSHAYHLRTISHPEIDTLAADNTADEVRSLPDPLPRTDHVRAGIAGFRGWIELAPTDADREGLELVIDPDTLAIDKTQIRAVFKPYNPQARDDGTIALPDPAYTRLLGRIDLPPSLLTDPVMQDDWPCLVQAVVDADSREEVLDALGCSSRTLTQLEQIFDLNVEQATTRPWQFKTCLAPTIQHEKTVDAIAERLGCAPSTVRTWADTHDLTLPEPESSSTDRTAAIAEAVRTSQSWEEVAAQFDVTPRTVRKWFERLDLPAPPWSVFTYDGTQKITNRQRVATAIDRADTLDEAAASLEIAPEELLRWAVRHAVDDPIVRERSEFVPWRDRSTIQTAVNGADSWQAVADTLGCSPVLAYNWAKHYGIHPGYWDPDEGVHS